MRWGQRTQQAGDSCTVRSPAVDLCSRRVADNLVPRARRLEGEDARFIRCRQRSLRRRFSTGRLL